MHILLIHQVFVRPQDPGGTRHYEFARYFVEHGHRVTVLAGTRSYLTGERLPAPSRQQLEPGLEVLRCGVLGGRGAGTAWRTIGFLSFALTSLWRGLRTPRVDLVWGTSPPLFQAWSAWAVSWLKRTPWVLEIRDLWPAFAIEIGALRNRLLIALSRALERFLYRRADRVVVNSPGFLEHVGAAGGAAEKLVTVPNGVDSGSFDSDAASLGLRAEHGLQHKFIALYAGAHGPANDLRQVLQAAESLKQHPGIVLVLVGDGAQKAELMAYARSHRLDNVLFLPPVEKSGIPGVLAEADCGIATLKPLSLFTTTYPNKVFDYMAAGKPVVLAIDGVIRRLVESAGAGLYVEPGDGEALGQAVAQLQADPELARQMGRRGRACVEAQYDRKLLAKQMQELLQSVVQG